MRYFKVQVHTALFGWIDTNPFLKFNYITDAHEEWCLYKREHFMRRYRIKMFTSKL